MRKTAFVFAFMLLACSAFAEGGKDRSWFETTLKGLKSKIAARYQVASAGSASVAAVRGSQVADTSAKPYWKGTPGDKQHKKLLAQRKEFAAALELAMDGKDAEAKAALEKFIKKNPKSPFLEDAKEALRRLDAAPETSAAAAPVQAETAKPAEPAAPAVQAASPDKSEPAVPAKAEVPENSGK